MKIMAMARRFRSAMIKMFFKMLDSVREEIRGDGPMHAKSDGPELKYYMYLFSHFQKLQPPCCDKKKD